MDPEERAEQARQARRRIAVLRSVVLALDNARLVSETLMAAADRPAALIALQGLLGVDETGARAIAELQWARLTRDTRSHTVREIAEIEAVLGDLEG